VYDDVDFDDDSSEVPDDDRSSSAVPSVMSATIEADAVVPATAGDPSRRSVAKAAS